MLNQQNNQSFNLLIKFNIAFCKLYSLEIQQQKLYKELLDLQRKLLDTHNSHNQAKHLPLTDLEIFFTKTTNLARFHSYKIISRLTNLTYKLLPEINELLNMHLRLNHLKFDKGYIPNKDFNLDDEILNLISHYFQTNNLKISNIAKSIEEIYSSDSMQLLQTEGLNAEYSNLLASSKEAIKSLASEIDNNKNLNDFKSFLDINLKDKFEEIINYQNNMTTCWHDMYEAICALNKTSSDTAIKAKLLYETAQNLSNCKNHSLPEENHIPHECIITMTKFCNINNKNWLQYFDLDRFQQLSPNNDITTNIEKYEITSLNVLSQYGNILIKITPIYVNLELIHLEASIVIKNIKCTEDYELSKKLILNFASCYSESNYKQIVIDSEDLSTINELTENIFKNNFAEVVVSERAMKSITSNMQNDNTLCKIEISPEPNDLFKQNQNVLNLGFIPTLSSEDTTSLRFLTLDNSLKINILDYRTSLVQLRFCFENGINIISSEECFDILLKNIAKQDALTTINIFAFTTNDLTNKIQLALDLGLIPTIDIRNQANFECFKKVSQDKSFTLTQTNEKILYKQIIESFKQGIFVKFKEEELGYKLRNHLNKQNSNNPFVVNFNNAKTCIKAAEYLSKFGLKFHYTIDSWLQVIKYSDQKDLTLSVIFQKPTFYDLKCLIENGFIIQLEQDDKEHLVTNINKIGQEDENGLTIVFARYPINSAKNIFYKTQYIEEINKLTNFKINYFNDYTSEKNNLLELANYTNSTIEQEFSILPKEHQLYGQIKNYIENSKTNFNPLKKLAELENLCNQHLDDHQLSTILSRIERMIVGLYINTSKEDKATADSQFEQNNKYITLASNFAKPIDNELTIRTQKISSVVKKLKQKQQVLQTKPNQDILSSLSAQEVKIIQNESFLEIEDIEYLSIKAIIQRIKIVDKRISSDSDCLSKDLLEELKILALKLSKFGVDNEL